MTDRAFRRTALAASAALVGLALIAYGAGWHGRSVIVPQEKHQAPPPPPDMVQERSISFFAAPDNTAPATARQETVMSFKSEPQMMIEATRGGLAISADGRLRLTYSGGAPPSRCPT